MENTMEDIREESASPEAQAEGIRRKTAKAELDRIQDEMPSIFEKAQEQLNTGKFPLLYWGEKVAWLHCRDWADGRWFFAGDMHGDFLALHTILQWVEAQAPGDFRLCFMGDLVDRGPHSAECFALMMEAALKFPDKILWLMGNHDDGLEWSSAKNEFVSPVSPSEFEEWLDDGDGEHSKEAKKEWGLLFSNITKKLPRAVLFPDGLLATHGGFPLVDRLPPMKALKNSADKFQWLSEKGCLDDFTWTRASKNKRKIPNRTTHGCSYGYQDFEEFCDAVRDFFPVQRMVCGHDHPPDGFAFYEFSKKNPVLILRAFGFPNDATEREYKPKIIAGRYVVGALPKVEMLDYEISDREAVFAKPEPKPAAELKGKPDSLSSPEKSEPAPVEKPEPQKKTAEETESTREKIEKGDSVAKSESGLSGSAPKSSKLRGLLEWFRKFMFGK